MDKFLRGLLFSLLITMGLAPSAYAWNGVGHSKVASIAWSRLTPAVQKKLMTLLKSGDDVPGSGCTYDTIEKGATWLDCIRTKIDDPERKISPFHADRRQVCEKVDVPSSCKSKICATEKLKSAIETLNKKEDTAERRIALKQVLHLMGDLHQPLHVFQAADPSSNGNNLKVKVGEKGKEVTTHQYWDNEVTADIKNYQATFDKMIKEFGSEMEKGDLDAWLEETVTEGTNMVYAPPLNEPMCDAEKIKAKTWVLTPEYIENSKHFAYYQIAKAGVRLALILNKAFAGE